MSSNLDAKKAVVEEIIGKMREAKSVVFFDYVGINVEQATKMRKEFPMRTELTAKFIRIPLQSLQLRMWL